jgi:hypothetical protein
VDLDHLRADRRDPRGDPEKSGRDYRRATDYAPVHPHVLSRRSTSRRHDRDTGRAPCCGRRRRSGRGRAQENKDSSDRDGNAAPHEATLNRLVSSVKPTPPAATRLEALIPKSTASRVFTTPSRSAACSRRHGCTHDAPGARCRGCSRRVRGPRARPARSRGRSAADRTAATLDATSELSAPATVGRPP